jgi:hypothetical protein
VRVTCPCCHHAEAWTDEGKTLLMEGGLRTPSPHPTLAAWRTIRRAWEGELGSLVGPCPECAQPMFAEASKAWKPWPLHLPDGRILTATEKGVADREEIVDLEGIDALLENTWGETWLPRQVRVGQAAFEGGLLTMMLFPLLAWCVAVGSVLIYLLNFSGVPF